MIYNLSSYHNGLGDSLQFSTFAETLSKQGHTVNLYTGPEVMPFRNPQIKELVWDHNPYITGNSVTDWNIGDIPGKPYSNTQDSFIKNWEVIFGLPPVNELPKIYYKPKKITPQLYGPNITTISTTAPHYVPKFGLIELSSQTLKYNADNVRIAVNTIIERYNMPFMIMVSGYQSSPITLPEDTPYITGNITLTSLFHAADLINSCQVLITLNSGLHSLAAAIRRDHNFEQWCLLPDNDYGWIMSEKKFIFTGINYVKV